MKKLVCVYCLYCLMTSFHANNTGEKISAIDYKKLNGKWIIIELYSKNKKEEIQKFPNCEMKETVKFQDSFYVIEKYTTFLGKCYKEVNKSKYKIQNRFNNKTKHFYDYLAVNIRGRNEELFIKELNDTILKIGTRERFYSDSLFSTLKVYKKIK